MRNYWKEFQVIEDIHCHHIKPRCQGGGDEYKNLILVFEPVHRLIHITDIDLIRMYIQRLKIDKNQILKLNELRKQAGMPVIRLEQI